MPEFRQNPATKEWVILAPERGKRPHELKRSTGRERLQLPAYREDCPFCKGNEHLTTKPVYERPEGPDWQVRVVPNKFAALKRNHRPVRDWTGRFLCADGFGIADVVVEHPSHNTAPALMTTDEVALYLRACRDRHAEIDKNDKINLITVFRNHGARAGTSLEHPHSQIIATPIVPPHVRYPIEQAVAHYDEYGSCVYCDMVAEELDQAARIVVETEDFAAFCPYAARSPFECRIYPKRHRASFHQVSDEEIVHLAAVLRTVLAKLYHTLDDPDYNYVIRSAPVGDHDTRYLHWYMVIIPKVAIPAGFEIGTGIYINTIAPEECAQVLRDSTD